MKYEYKVLGIIHAGLMNPWKTNKNGVFEEPTNKLNELGNEGWELVSSFSAGNNDRGIYIFKKQKLIK